MTKLSKLIHASPMALAMSLAATAGFAPLAAHAELSGNIGVHSKYLLRGIFEENDDTAVQGGIDWASDNSGWYLGWWASNLGYTYDSGSPGVNVTERGFENDVYGGYSGETSGGLGWDIGLIQYLYVNVDDSNLTELTAGVSYGMFSAGFQYLLNDGWWGNAGDIYWKLGFSTDLPRGFSFAADLGYYTYDDSDNKRLGGCNGTSVGCNVTTDTSSFRHLNLTLSHPISTTGAEAYVQYTFAGKDRSGNDYDDSVVIGATYSFNL